MVLLRVDVGVGEEQEGRLTKVRLPMLAAAAVAAVVRTAPVMAGLLSCQSRARRPAEALGAAGSGQYYLVTRELHSANQSSATAG